ncbi:MAG: hypothetical protein M1840_005196 [Geoglossum simile]|nr:MAG: hypothetical protein M1840_005196 [Geoglossum simile]
MGYKLLLEDPELFQPGECEYFEIWEDEARGSGQGGPCKLKDEDVSDFVDRQVSYGSWIVNYPCYNPPPPEGASSLLNPNTSLAPTILSIKTPNTHPGPDEIFRAGPTPKLPLGPAAFDKLVRGCKLPFQVLEAHTRHANAGRASKFTFVDESSNRYLSFLFLLRMQTSLISLAAFSHSMGTGVTTGVVLQPGSRGAGDITMALAHHRAFIGQPLLLPTILTDIALARSVERSLITRDDLDYIEDATQQHTWTEFIVERYNTGPKDITLEELMRRAHGLKIEVAVAQRKARVIVDLVRLLRETYTESLDSPMSAPRSFTPNSYEILEWINNLDSQARMESTDVDFLMRRAETQLSAIYSISSQQDSAANREVALQSQTISEATKRDSSAMKSLAFLSAFFFPGTFIAAIFSLEPMKRYSLRVYWAVTIPVTILTLGLWLAWTMYRAQVYRDTGVFNGTDLVVWRSRQRGDISADVEGQEAAISLDRIV